MTSFRSHDNSNAAFKFVFTGLVALSLLFAICVVFTLWYIIRKRRDEKSRHSRHIEETFPERLASRSTTGKGSSKIDLGFTSQQTLNKDQDDGERRPTFSRLLNLWKGLRNSKRKSANGNEEPRRSVVFTIPTEDVFPKTHARQQTYYCAEDKLNQTDGVKTSHMCEVHQVTHDVIEEYSDHASSDEDSDMENELTEKASHMEVGTEIEGNTNNGNGSLRSGPTLDEGRVDTLETLDRRSSDDRQLQGKEGKSFSKESDVDSGCGSSCHEMYPSEAQITHAQLNITTLAYCHAHKIEEYKMKETEDKFSNKVSVASPEVNESDIEYMVNTTEDKLSKKIPVASLEGRDIHSNAELGLCEQQNLDSSSNEDCSHEFQRQKVAADSFEELIKLAKDGMSTLARKRVDNSGKKNRNTIPDCFLDTTLVDKLSDTRDSATNTDKGLESQGEEKLSRGLTDSKLCLDARKVDSGVKCSSSTSLCLDDQANLMGKTLCCIEIQARNAVESIRDLPSNSVSSIGSLHSDYASATSCVIEIPTIILESEQDTGKDSAGTTAVQIPCSGEQDSYHEVNIDQCLENYETTCGINEDALQQTQKAVTFDKQNDLPVRIGESFLKNGITEKATRPQSLVLPATNTAAANENKYGSKVPSLETLNLPSHENNGRIRSFSATIRRKMSFRERISSDDMDIERQVDPGMPKSKKIKGFRSFRVNKKKKIKSSKTEDISQSTGCLDGSNSKKYWSTFDKLFHENTGSISFSDVPFTIPEISE